ncbi:MAG: hypothetical protein KBF12_12905 [Sebaldella sp.]|nr:hypothetical protein [Sebaldella sp.]
MRNFFLVIFVFTYFISYSEEEIFLKVLKKEIKIENVKIKINDSRKTSLHIEEYKLYKNGEIIKKYVSEGKKNKEIDYVVGMYNFLELKSLLEKIFKDDRSEIDSLKVNLSKTKKHDNDVFSNIEIPMENSMIIISINGENKYGIDSLYEINFKGNEITLVNDVLVYKSENIKELVKILNEKIEVNVIWYDHLRMKP